MRRLAFLATAVLAVSAAPAARAEQLDLDLTRLGAPDPAVWTTIIAPLGGTPAQAQTYATQSRQRFALLSSQMAMALSSAMLQPASTTGYSGFAVDLEVASAGVKIDPVGVATAGFGASAWPTASTNPSSLLIPSLHVRKALPYSFEVGGRILWVNSSNYAAVQGEAKWAVNEGFDYVPDVAVRAAFTRLLGVRDWNLSSTDLDILLSMRLASRGVVSFTPYLAARFTYVNSSTSAMDFAPCHGGGATCTLGASPQDIASTQAAFPTFKQAFYRTTLGLRFTTYSVSMAVEGTYFGGAAVSSGDYSDVNVSSTLSFAGKLGWEF